MKPRSKKALKSIQEARKAGDRFAQKIESIVQLPAYRYPAERWSLTQMSDALEKFDDFLAGLALRMGPSTSEETNKRLYRERYALRGLMWLFSRYFPAKKISSAPNSHFYRVAQCMFEEIEYDRQDYRQLIEEEKRLFLKEREEGSISVEGDLMMFVMNI